MILLKQAEATPPTEPEPTPERTGLTVELTGVDGSTWDLIGGLVQVVGGVTGLGAGDVEHWTQSAPTLDGSTHLGFRTPEREFYLPVTVGRDTITTRAWLNADRAFWQAIDPRGEVRLTVTAPDGASRYQMLRYAKGADPELEYDPVWRRYTVYGLTFLVTEPYWLGEEVVARFVHTDPPATFFPGPPFTIGSGQTIAEASVTNPGDVEAYPVWRIEGPFTGFTLGAGDSLVAMTLTKAAGQWVEVNMQPRKLTVVDEAGTDRWDALTDANFTGVAAGRDVALDVAVSGAGVGTAVQLTFTPRYRRAW